MGTVVSFSLREDRSTTTEPGEEQARRERIDAGVERARAKLQWVDDVFSTWKPESPMSRLRRGDIRLEDTPREVADVLELCRRVRVASDGWFDPWAMPGGVDPTGLVKGWAVERALDEFKMAGAPAAMINAGGDIAVFGQPAPGQPWRIAIENPWLDGPDPPDGRPRRSRAPWRPPARTSAARIWSTRAAAIPRPRFSRPR